LQPPEKTGLHDGLGKRIDLGHFVNSHFFGNSNLTFSGMGQASSFPNSGKPFWFLEFDSNSQRDEKKDGKDPPTLWAKNDSRVQNHKRKKRMQTRLIEPALVRPVQSNPPPTHHVNEPNQRKQVVKVKPSTPVKSNRFQSSVRRMRIRVSVAPLMVKPKRRQQMQQKEPQPQRPTPTCRRLRIEPIPHSREHEQTVASH
jgi:hypothetical protein